MLGHDGVVLGRRALGRCARVLRGCARVEDTGCRVIRVLRGNARGLVMSIIGETDEETDIIL